METGHDTEFKHMSKEVLAETLRKFYPAARQKPTNEDDEPKPYAKQPLVNIHSSINRYFHRFYTCETGI